MKAMLLESFGSLPKIAPVADPSPEGHSVVIEVKASGVCRSDWHCWLGHDTGVTLPHVPGHEFAGVVAEVGSHVSRFRIGDRVMIPFINACGSCPECYTGNQQVFTYQTQPGFTHWGSFAQFTRVDQADHNLVPMPASMSFETAASMGCRFVTAFRAVVDQGQVKPGVWVAVHGCGGVGLSSIMIAVAMGARVVAVDVDQNKLKMAKDLGASATVDASAIDQVGAAIQDLTGGGAQVSLDAFGHPQACVNSIQSLRPLGRHVQVGLLMADQANPALPMDIVIGKELEILGSHGMQAHRYPAMLQMIESGRLRPEQLLGRTISLDDAPDILMAMDGAAQVGVTVINQF